MTFDASVFLSAASGVIVGGGVVGFVVRTLLGRIEKLEDKVATDHERRLESLSRGLGYKAEKDALDRVETELHEFRGRCIGPTMEPLITRLEGAVNQLSAQISDFRVTAAENRQTAAANAKWIRDINTQHDEHVKDRTLHHA